MATPKDRQNRLKSQESIVTTNKATGETESSTTVAIGKDTYTIVTTRKPSANSGKMVSNNNAENANPASANGETIRIFRRSRSGRPFPQVPAAGNNLEEVDPADAAAVVAAAAAEERLLRTEDLPNPDSPLGIKEANTKLKQLIGRIRDDPTSIESDTLVSNLEYIADVVGSVAVKAEEEAVGDDLSELHSEAVPEEVRKWLASTFAKQASAPRRRGPDERPSFRSVANAIRTGIFIERIYRRMSSSQLMVIPPEVQQALKGVDHWNFDTFTLTRVCKAAPLKYLGYELLTRHGFLHKYKVPPSMLESMLSHLETGYSQNGNPYHNNMHACDVLQTIHYFISQTGLASWMSDLEIFTSLMAAIIHDYDHSGTTNNFHINSGSGLTLLYNDRAVLENHHVSAFFRMIAENDCNIFANMQKTDFREFRNLIIEMVLHTDMSQHFSQLKAMKSLLQQHSGESSFDKTKVLCLMLHSCDVSHPAKRWSLHHRWTARCMEEFFVQGDREQELGLEYSPLCDRHNTMVPQSQIGFIDYIVSPTLNILGDGLDCILSTMEITHNNRKCGGPNSTLPENETTKSTTSNSGRTLVRPWTDILAANRERWQKKHDAGEQGIEFDQLDRPASNYSSRPSSASTTVSSTESKHNRDMFMQARVRLHEGNNKENEKAEEGESKDDAEDKTDSPEKSPYHIDSKPPNVDTKLVDVVDELPENILSRPGTPDQWAFDDKEVSLQTAPPRAASATLCSPPMPRKVPISVDHHLRK